MTFQKAGGRRRLRFGTYSVYDIDNTIEQTDKWIFEGQRKNL